MSRIAGIAVLGLLATGCVSISHVQTADTLGQGNFQFAMEPGIAGVAVIAGGEKQSIMYPHIDFAARYGVHDRVDLGMRLGTSLAEAQLKVLLTSPEDQAKAISVAPSVMTLAIGPNDDNGVRYTNLALPVLVGLKTQGGSELVLGPRVTLTRLAASADGDTEATNIISAGGSLGFALRVSHGFRLMPEVGISFPVAGGKSLEDSDSKMLLGLEKGVVQFKLGFLFGGGRPVPKREEAPSSPAESPEPPARPAAPPAESIPDEVPAPRTDPPESTSSAPSEV